jgi:hypothetical protein
MFKRAEVTIGFGARGVSQTQIEMKMVRGACEKHNGDVSSCFLPEPIQACLQITLLSAILCIQSNLHHLEIYTIELIKAKRTMQLTITAGARNARKWVNPLVRNISITKTVLDFEDIKRFWLVPQVEFEDKFLSVFVHGI